MMTKCYTNDHSKKTSNYANVRNKFQSLDIELIAESCHGKFTLLASYR